MEPRVVAVPSETKLGLDAGRSDHFGRAPYFTIVQVKGRKVGRNTTVTNPPNRQVGHDYPVELLAREGVTDVVVAGIGEPMHRMLRENSVHVWREQDTRTVGAAIDALMAGAVEPLDGGTH
jgi:predicted Fe-Mo cluster-binding NifX family protein